MGYIRKIKLHNFRRFQNLSLEFNDNLNVLIGDNESGKSTILEAINITLSGKRKKIETLDLEGKFNYEAIRNFLASERKYEDLPKLFIEIYFDEQNNYELNGKNNSDLIECDGLKFECRPNVELSKEIAEIISSDDAIFPFEFYSINYMTFAEDGYSGYKKYLNHISIDHSQIGSGYAIREYIKDMYYSTIIEKEKPKQFNEYRKSKNDFTNIHLSEMNSRLGAYKFSLRNDSKSNLETDLTIVEGDIDISNKGKGLQCFIKTAFALSRANDSLDVIMIEEPENHLSHVNVNKLINKIIESAGAQIIISTHSNMILSRLNLRKAILLNSSSQEPTLLNTLSDPTSKYSMKAPNNNVLNYILSKKVLLVEGDAEFILMEQFYNNTTRSQLSLDDIHIISVGGTSFKRYLELGRLLNIKTAVIRDNDKNYEINCIQNYEEYVNDHIKIFYVEDNTKYTFEKCLYDSNQQLCEDKFSRSRRTLSVLEYMLSNKAEVAFNLLEENGPNLIVPNYIRDAILWLNA